MDKHTEMPALGELTFWLGGQPKDREACSRSDSGSHCLVLVWLEQCEYMRSER